MRYKSIWIPNIKSSIDTINYNKYKIAPNETPYNFVFCCGHKTYTDNIHKGVSLKPKDTVYVVHTKCRVCGKYNTILVHIRDGEKVPYKRDAYKGDCAKIKFDKEIANEKGE